MQGIKDCTEKLFTSFQLSNRIPKENLYRKLRETLDLRVLYKDTKNLMVVPATRRSIQLSFPGLLLTGYLENITSDRKLVKHAPCEWTCFTF